MTRVSVRRHVRRRVEPRLRPFRQPEIPAFHVVTGEEPLGQLVARGELQKMCETRGKLFGIDELVGDDQYVFLSVGKPFMLGSLRATCFLFDAEELVREGALVRARDLLTTPQGERLLLALDDAQSKRGLGPGVSPLDLERDDVQSLINQDANVRQAWKDFVAVRDATTLSGSQALDALRKCTDCEILVPKRLALSKALRAAPRGRIEGTTKV